MTGMERNGDIVLLGAYVNGSRVVCCLNCFGGLWRRAKSMLACALVGNCARRSSSHRHWPGCLPNPICCYADARNPLCPHHTPPLRAQAPLFVHWNNRPWPTNMIAINNHQ